MCFTDLDEILSFGFRHERLQLWSGECVYEAGLGNDQEKDLRAGEDGELVRLWLRRIRGQRLGLSLQMLLKMEGRRSYLLHDPGFPLGEGNVASRFVLNELDLDLPPLPTGFIVIVVVVIGRGAGPWAFGATIDIQGSIIAVTRYGCWVLCRRRGLLVVIGDLSHGGIRKARGGRQLRVSITKTRTRCNRDATMKLDLFGSASRKSVGFGYRLFSS